MFGGCLLLSLYHSNEAGKETVEVEASLLMHIPCPLGTGPGTRYAQQFNTFSPHSMLHCMVGRQKS